MSCLPPSWKLVPFPLLRKAIFTSLLLALLPLPRSPLHAARVGGSSEFHPTETVPPPACPEAPSLLPLSEEGVEAYGAFVPQGAGPFLQRDLARICQLFDPVERLEWLECRRSHRALYWFRRGPGKAGDLAERCADRGWQLRSGRVGHHETRYLYGPDDEGLRMGFNAVHLGHRTWLASLGPISKNLGVRRLLNGARKNLLAEDGSPHLPARDLRAGAMRRTSHHPSALALWAAGRFPGDLSPFVGLRRHEVCLRPVPSPTRAEAIEAHVTLEASAAAEARTILAMWLRASHGNDWPPPSEILAHRARSRGRRVEVEFRLTNEGWKQMRMRDPELFQQVLRP